MMSVFIPCHRSLYFLEKYIRLARSFADSFPSRIPDHECMVLPPMLRPAIPVEAVIATLADGPPSVFMISRSRTDFPVPAAHIRKKNRESCVEIIPAGPVKKTLSQGGE